MFLINRIGCWCIAFAVAICSVNVVKAQETEELASANKPAPNPAQQWAHWRGPTMDGHSYAKNLPDTWSPDGENLLWRSEELGSRGTPVAMNGKMYLVARAYPETTKEGEKTVCFDPKTGKIIWESIHNVFLSDAPAERVGWVSPVCDPKSNQVYVLGLSGVFQCLDGDTGKTIWEHSLMEEFGMISPYGGRTNLATVFEDLVIVSSVMTGWGEAAVPAHRFIAFDRATGMTAWSFTARPRPEDTTYSTPVFKVIGGQALMVVGAADGALYALQPRTGNVVWKYQASPRGINTTPMIDEDGIVYCGHAEKNESSRTTLGALFAIDGRSSGEVTEDKLLWKIPGVTVSRCSPLKVGDRLYVVDDGGKLYILEAKTGKEIAIKKLGRVMFGSMLAADGKIYVAENSGRTFVLKPTEAGVEVLSNPRLSDNGECFGTPMTYEGRIYLPVTTALYCIGKEQSDTETEALANQEAETPASKDTTVAHIQIAPVELLLRPGNKVGMQIRAYNKNGRFLKLVSDAEVSIEGGGNFSNNEYVAPSDNQPLVAFITAKFGELTSKSRVRVVPDLPMSTDFNDGKVPDTWIGAAYRHQPVNVEGDGALVKISTIPKGTRSQAWFGLPSLHDYTVQADLFATDKRGKDTTDRLPDMGLIAQRYTLDLKGNGELQIRSWTPRLESRFAKTIPFSWKQQTWYTMKFQSETVGESCTLRGKVWERGTPEPTEWQIEATDQTGNLRGSPGMFGNSTDAQFYVDNVKVTAN